MEQNKFIEWNNLVTKLTNDFLEEDDGGKCIIALLLTPIQRAVKNFEMQQMLKKDKENAI